MNVIAFGIGTVIYILLIFVISPLLIFNFVPKGLSIKTCSGCIKNKCLDKNGIPYKINDKLDYNSCIIRSEFEECFCNSVCKEECKEDTDANSSSCSETIENKKEICESVYNTDF
jgi:hypothetical protein